MPNDLPVFDPCRVWRQQEIESMTLTMDDLRGRSLAFEKSIRRRNLREFVAGSLALAVSAYQMATMRQLTAQLSMALLCAGMVLVLWRLMSRGAAASLPEEMGRANCIAFHRRELARQRDLLSAVWRWYLAPFVPGLALLTMDAFVSSAGNRRWLAVGFAAFVAGAFWLIANLNRHAAERLAAQVREIESWENGRD